MKKDVFNEHYLTHPEMLYKEIIEYSVETIVIHADYEILYINEAGTKIMRGTKEEIIGSCLLDRYRKESKPLIKESIQKSMVENVPGELMEEKMYTLDGTLMDIELYCLPVQYGNKRALQTTIRDISTRKEIERHHKREINKVSAPIVPVYDGISVLPLVGSIDSGRAKQLLETIPKEMQKQNVHWLIIDFSGIYNFDKFVTAYLLKIKSVLELLGVRTIITGIKPEFAQLAVHLGINISSIHSMANVKQALQSLGIGKVE
ncbi:STAS domain-containing protein [Peribacillus sp. NPDC060253]|uniref:STAS domain-containing protein n=1 Tax=Peribacillus sp. NPDC060253 TaxID=3347084 RepID=UPI00366530E3